MEKIKKLETKHLPYENLKENHAKFKYYTGVHVDVFDCLFDYHQAEKDIKAVKKTKKGRHRLLSYRDQLIITLIKLRLNTWLTRWAVQKQRFMIFFKWINVMYKKLKFLIKWLDHNTSMQTLPKLTIIIDCTEIFIDHPKTYKARAQVYSNYKKYSTVKFLIACTPLGSISFI